MAEWRLRHSPNCKLKRQPPGDAFPEFLVLWALIPIIFFSFSQSKLPGYILPSIPPITILTGDYLFRRGGRDSTAGYCGGHAVLSGIMTMFALLLPWFVVHGPDMPPTRSPGYCTGDRPRSGAADRGGGEWLRRGSAAPGYVRSPGGTGVVSVRCRARSLAFQPSRPPSASIRLLDRSYSARPLADRLAGLAPANETVAVFRVRRDMEYGLAFYRNHEVANYEEDGVPAEQHLLVARVTGRKGTDLHTAAALEEYLEGRHYELLFGWPEQGLEVYLVGAR